MLFRKLFSAPNALSPLMVLAAALTLSACGSDSSGSSNNTGGATATGGAGGTSSGGGGAGGNMPVVGQVVGLTAGFESTCARLQSMGDIRYKCWGNNARGQLGLGDTEARGDEPGEMGAALPAIEFPKAGVPEVFAGTNDFQCAVLAAGGEVRCFGHNGNGQLGLGDTNDRGGKPGEMGDALASVDLGLSATPVTVATGYTHACIAQDDGAVKCWGDNGACQLGQGTIGGNIGDAPGEMGGALVSVDLGTGAFAKQLAAGRSHTCALLSDGTVKCWGGNTDGQLGLGDAQPRGCTGDTLGDNLPVVDLGGTPAIAITAGANHTCALLSDGTVKCWGAGESGQLGQGTTADIGKGPGEMGAALASIDLGFEADSPIAQISAGDAHTCARAASGEVKCWGANKYGQLGQGSTLSLGDEPGEMGAALPAVALGVPGGADTVRAGQTHTCALLLDATVKCWGSGASGALGQGNMESLGDEPGEMDSALPTVKLWSDAH